MSCFLLYHLSGWGPGAPKINKHHNENMINVKYRLTTYRVFYCFFILGF